MLASCLDNWLPAAKYGQNMASLGIFRRLKLRCSFINSLCADGLGLLVLVVAVGLLHPLDQLDVLLLSLLDGGAVINNGLPCVLLGLALLVVTIVSCCGETGEGKLWCTLRSNMPGAGAFSKSSPVPTLKRAIHTC